MICPEPSHVYQIPVDILVCVMYLIKQILQINSKLKFVSRQMKIKMDEHILKDLELVS